MGRATRWLKSLFGMKRDKDKKDNSVSNSDHRKNMTSPPPPPPPPNISPPWLHSFYTEKEQNKHAIAVAAATAAAADAAVAAAQAAVAVVRLTSQGRGTMFAAAAGGGHEKWAAVKIQTLFRGFLARKALRALKGLVKIQALVRGFLVRKQATSTLHSMQALMRAQATVRSHKARRSMERFDETIEGSPKIVEVDTGYRQKWRSRRSNTSMSDFGDEPLLETVSSPLPIPQIRTWGLTGEECRFSTAQSTPRFANSCRCETPKSVCGERLVWNYGNFPNYMANTQSFKAKLRSRSAPRQRAELGGSVKKRLSLNEMMESRNSLSGVRMQRSCSQVQDAINFKNAVMGKIEKSTEFGRDIDGDAYYLQRRW